MAWMWRKTDSYMQYMMTGKIQPFNSVWNAEPLYSIASYFIRKGPAEEPYTIQAYTDIDEVWTSKVGYTCTTTVFKYFYFNPQYYRTPDLRTYDSELMVKYYALPRSFPLELGSESALARCLTVYPNRRIRSVSYPSNALFLTALSLFDVAKTIQFKLFYGNALTEQTPVTWYNTPTQSELEVHNNRSIQIKQYAGFVCLSYFVPTSIQTSVNNMYFLLYHGLTPNNNDAITYHFLGRLVFSTGHVVLNSNKIGCKFIKGESDFMIPPAVAHLCPSALFSNIPDVVIKSYRQEHNNGLYPDLENRLAAALSADGMITDISQLINHSSSQITVDAISVIRSKMVPVCVVGGTLRIFRVFNTTQPITYEIKTTQPLNEILNVIANLQLKFHTGQHWLYKTPSPTLQLATCPVANIVIWADYISKYTDGWSCANLVESATPSWIFQPQRSLCEAFVTGNSSVVNGSLPTSPLQALYPQPVPDTAISIDVYDDGVSFSVNGEDVNITLRNAIVQGTLPFDDPTNQTYYTRDVSIIKQIIPSLSLSELHFNRCIVPYTGRGSHGTSSCELMATALCVIAPDSANPMYYAYNQLGLTQYTGSKTNDDMQTVSDINTSRRCLSGFMLLMQQLDTNLIADIKILYTALYRSAGFAEPTPGSKISVIKGIPITLAPYVPSYIIDHSYYSFADEQCIAGVLNKEVQDQIHTLIINNLNTITSLPSFLTEFLDNNIPENSDVIILKLGHKVFSTTVQFIPSGVNTTRASQLIYNLSLLKPMYLSGNGWLLGTRKLELTSNAAINCTILNAYLQSNMATFTIEQVSTTDSGWLHGSMQSFWLTGVKPPSLDAVTGSDAAYLVPNDYKNGSYGVTKCSDSSAVSITSPSQVAPTSLDYLLHRDIIANVARYNNKTQNPTLYITDAAYLARIPATQLGSIFSRHIPTWSEFTATNWSLGVCAVSYEAICALLSSLSLGYWQTGSHDVGVFYEQLVNKHGLQPYTGCNTIAEFNTRSERNRAEQYCIGLVGMYKFWGNDTVRVNVNNMHMLLYASIESDGISMSLWSNGKQFTTGINIRAGSEVQIKGVWCPSVYCHMLAPEVASGNELSVYISAHNNFLTPDISHALLEIIPSFVGVTITPQNVASNINHNVKLSAILASIRDKVISKITPNTKLRFNNLPLVGATDFVPVSTQSDTLLIELLTWLEKHELNPWLKIGAWLLTHPDAVTLPTNVIINTLLFEQFLNSTPTPYSVTGKASSADTELSWIFRKKNSVREALALGEYSGTLYTNIQNSSLYDLWGEDGPRFKNIQIRSYKDVTVAIIDGVTISDRITSTILTQSLPWEDPFDTVYFATDAHLLRQMNISPKYIHSTQIKLDSTDMVSLNYLSSECVCTMLSTYSSYPAPISTEYVSLGYTSYHGCITMKSFQDVSDYNWSHRFLLGFNGLVLQMNPAFVTAVTTAYAMLYISRSIDSKLDELIGLIQKFIPMTVDDTTRMITHGAIKCSPKYAHLIGPDVIKDKSVEQSFRNYVYPQKLQQYASLISNAVIAYGEDVNLNYNQIKSSTNPNVINMLTRFKRLLKVESVPAGTQLQIVIPTPFDSFTASTTTSGQSIDTEILICLTNKLNLPQNPTGTGLPWCFGAEAEPVQWSPLILLTLYLSVVEAMPDPQISLRIPATATDPHGWLWDKYNSVRQLYCDGTYSGFIRSDSSDETLTTLATQLEREHGITMYSDGSVDLADKNKIMLSELLINEFTAHPEKYKDSFDDILYIRDVQFVLDTGISNPFLKHVPRFIPGLNADNDNRMFISVEAAAAALSVYNFMNNTSTADIYRDLNMIQYFGCKSRDAYVIVSQENSRNRIISGILAHASLLPVELRDDVNALFLSYYIAKFPNNIDQLCKYYNQLNTRSLTINGDTITVNSSGASFNVRYTHFTPHALVQTAEAISDLIPIFTDRVNTYDQYNVMEKGLMNQPQTSIYEPKAIMASSNPVIRAAIDAIKTTYCDNAVVQSTIPLSQLFGRDFTIRITSHERCVEEILTALANAELITDVKDWFDN